MASPTEEAHGVLEYKNGDIYIGNLLNGSRSGIGILKFGPNQKNSYKGYWKDDKKSSKGLLKDLTTGDRYFGEFKANFKHGFGFGISNSTLSIGHFDRDSITGPCIIADLNPQPQTPNTLHRFFGQVSHPNLPHGFGTLITYTPSPLPSPPQNPLYTPQPSSLTLPPHPPPHTPHTHYLGQFSSGSKSGYGILTDPKKLLTYTGQFHSDKKNGFGILKSLDQGNILYRGHFTDNKFSGLGIEYYNWSSDKYVGEFIGGQRDGLGSYYKNASKEGGLKLYSGEYRGDRKEGYGCHWYGGDDRYVGEFYGDKKHGSGKWFVGGRLAYEGEWFGGVMHGFGVCYSLGEGGRGEVIFMGGFEEGVKSGFGKFFYS